MDKNLRILPSASQLYEFCDSFLHRLLYQGIVRDTIICKDKEHVQLHMFRDMLIKCVLLQAPGLHQQPAYAVAVYRQAKFLFRDGKAYTCGR